MNILNQVRNFSKITISGIKCQCSQLLHFPTSCYGRGYNFCLPHIRVLTLKEFFICLKEFSYINSFNYLFLLPWKQEQKQVQFHRLCPGSENIAFQSDYSSVHALLILVTECPFYPDRK